MVVVDVDVDVAMAVVVDSKSVDDSHQKIEPCASLFSVLRISIDR